MTLQTVPGRHRSAQSFSAFAELTTVLGQAGLSGARVAATVGVAGGRMAAGSAIPANAAPAKASAVTAAAPAAAPAVAPAAVPAASC